jgi:hypothetical protein
MRCEKHPVEPEIRFSGRTSRTINRAFHVFAHLSRPARSANRITNAATTTTIPRAKRIVLITLLSSGDTIRKYYTMGEFKSFLGLFRLKMKVLAHMPVSKCLT